MAQRQELRHLSTEFLGGKKAGEEIFPPLSWRNSGFRAHTELTRASLASHSLPPQSRRRPETCRRPARSGPVRRGSTAGLCPARAAREPQHPRAAGETLPRPSLTDPRPEPPALLSGPRHLQPPQPQRGSNTPPKAPHRGRARQGPRLLRRTRRAPRTHRRRRLLRPPAPQQQHQAAGGQAAAPPPQLHPARSGAPGPALRRGHSPAGQRGSCRRLAPAAPTPAPAPLPHSPASPGSSPPGTTVFLRSGGGRCGARYYRPSSRRPQSPPTLPSGAAVLSARRAGAASPRPAPPPGGQLDPGLFSAAEVAGVGG